VIGDLVSSVDVTLDKEEYVLLPNPIVYNVSLRSNSAIVSQIEVIVIYGNIVLSSLSVESLDVNLLIPSACFFILQINGNVVTQKMIKL